MDHFSTKVLLGHFLFVNLCTEIRNIIGHRELIICPIDSNGESLIFDSLFCISEYMGITLCLKLQQKYGYGDSRVKKHTFTCSFFNQLMLITGSHFFGKTHYRLASKLLISFSETKNHKINALGSHLYMNLKKNDFWIC